MGNGSRSNLFTGNKKYIFVVAPPRIELGSKV